MVTYTGVQFFRGHGEEAVLQLTFEEAESTDDGFLSLRDRLQERPLKLVEAELERVIGQDEEVGGA